MKARAALGIFLAALAAGGAAVAAQPVDITYGYHPYWTGAWYGVILKKQELWKKFVDEVDAQSKVALGVRLDLSGPWPPFDFVQMQLGA